MASTAELVAWVTQARLLTTEKAACVAAGLDPKKVAFARYLVEKGLITDG